MSTTDCETGTVRIRVGLFNDILRFVRALCIILHGESYNFILHCDALIAKHTQAHSQHQTNKHNIQPHTHTPTHGGAPPPWRRNSYHKETLIHRYIPQSI